MGLFDRLTKFRVDGQMMLSTKVLSTVILMSVEIESVGNFFQMLSSFVGFLCSGCVVGSEGDSFYGGEELILFAFFVAFMEFIDDLDEPGLEFFHIVFGETFLFFLEFQQYIVLKVHHLVASGVLLDFLRNFIFGLHCHDSLEFVLNNNFRVLSLNLIITTSLLITTVELAFMRTIS